MSNIIEELAAEARLAKHGGPKHQQKSHGNWSRKSDTKTPDKKAPEKKAPEKKAPEKKATADKAPAKGPEKKTTAQEEKDRVERSVAEYRARRQARIKEREAKQNESDEADRKWAEHEVRNYMYDVYGEKAEYMDIPEHEIRERMEHNREMARLNLRKRLGLS